MKKFMSILASALLLSASFVSCNSKKNKSGKLQVVATIYPAYNWVENVLGEKAADAELTLLLDNGVDLHNYQPSAEDIIKIANSDVFIYVGGESDGWVDDVLETADNKDMVVINLLEELGDIVKEEEMVEGMQASEHHHHHDGDDEHHHEEGEEHHHDDDDDEDEHHHEEEHHHDDDDDEDEHHHDEHHHDHDDDEDEDEHHHDEHHHHHDGPEYDEHVWLSLRNASVLTSKIADALCEADEKNADAYKANAAAYIKKLSDLDKDYVNAVAGAKKTTLLFADRFPFRYMVEDYNLKYYAAFIGCSAETEASFETVVFLANKVDELGLNVVLTIEGKNHKIAETVVSSTKKKNQKILTLDSLQSSTRASGQAGNDYISVMRSNLDVLKEALK
ncbi:metal ABC transporter substrate-binding protein [Treponema sp.]|uniref:metal ABC transporter substrate-binding protein n=1 Tax=Treponema sp. TaxID=166 RepID=UPI0025DB382C|nr:metal ABC transporter substrate-binding protein [Treponema sp.]MCR5217956.1 metal ABC transporter substrate-binding protein [Treponema sp.]